MLKNVLKSLIQMFSSEKVETFGNAVFNEIPSNTFSVDGVTLEQDEYLLQVLPTSPCVPIDGRPAFTYDASTVIANSTGRKIAVDLSHAIDYMGDAEAQGWIEKPLVAVNGALFAICKANAGGKDLLDNKKYGFTSPVIEFNSEVDATTGLRSVKSVVRLSLTNNPALVMASNFTAEVEPAKEADTVADTTTTDVVTLSAETQAVDTFAVQIEAFKVEIEKLKQEVETFKTENTSLKEQLASNVAKIEANPDFYKKTIGATATAEVEPEATLDAAELAFCAKNKLDPVARLAYKKQALNKLQK